MPATFRELAGVPPSTATPKDSVLVIIDAQNEYAEGALTISNLKTSRPAIASLLERYRAVNGHVVHVIHEVPEGTPVFTPGTSLAEEFSELVPKDEANEKIVRKKLPGSFTGTDLEDVLTATGLKKLVLVGYMAHVCVSTTAREGYQKGYDVLVAKDAVGDRDLPDATGEQLTQMVLTELGDVFATLVNSADIK